MADIKSIAEELVKLSTKEVNELAMVTKSEYDNEPASQISSIKEQAYKARGAKFSELSPKQYGISLLKRKRKKQ